VSEQTSQLLGHSSQTVPFTTYAVPQVTTHEPDLSSFGLVQVVQVVELEQTSQSVGQASQIIPFVFTTYPAPHKSTQLSD